MMFESLAEALMAFLSAGGFVSVFVCSFLKRALNKAREDAANGAEDGENG